MADNQPNRPQDQQDQSIIGRDAQSAQQQAGIAGEPQPRRANSRTSKKATSKSSSKARFPRMAAKPDAGLVLSRGND